MIREIFTQLVRKELPGLRRFLLAACSGNICEADDVAQEALMKAYLASRNFEDVAGFSAWLYRIACNTLIDHQRKQTAQIGRASCRESTGHRHRHQSGR